LGSPVHVFRVFVTSIFVSGCKKVECGPHQIWFIVLLPSENQGLKYTVTINIFYIYICSSVHRNSTLKKSNKLQLYPDI
jgi:hypothetical protein